MREKKIKELADALWYAYHEDPTTEGHMARVRNRKPILKMLTGEQIMDFAEAMGDHLKDQIKEVAREYVEGASVARWCRCLNPRCKLKEVLEDNLLHHYPAEGLLDTLSPGDTIPLGLCPECRGPVYQPEEFPEDEVDWDKDCDCLDCRQEKLRAKLIAEGVPPDQAATESWEQRAKWDQFGEAVRTERVPHKERDTESSTPVPSFGEPDFTGLNVPGSEDSTQ